MDSENDRKEEERKIISCCFLSFSLIHRCGFRKRQDDAEEKFLPRCFCPVAGFIHVDPEKLQREDEKAGN